MASISDIKGVGPATERALAEGGFTSIEMLAAASIENVVAVPGFGKVRAALLIAEARALLSASGDAEPVEDQASGSQEPEKPTEAGKPKKGKNDKKKKKSKKGKKKGKSKKKDKSKKSKSKK